MHRGRGFYSVFIKRKIINYQHEEKLPNNAPKIQQQKRTKKQKFKTPETGSSHKWELGNQNILSKIK